MVVFDRIAVGGFLKTIRSAASAQRARFLFPTLAAFALAAALVACGGSDGTNSQPYNPAPPQPTQPGSIAGRVLSADTALPVAGATVTAGGTTVTTGADGTFTIPGLTQADRVPVTITAPGHAQIVRITSVTGSIVTTVPTQMLTIAASVSIDAAVGGAATVPGSPAQVTVPAGAIVTSTGTAPTQAVLVRVTPINLTQSPGLLTGDYRTTNNGADAWLESFGAASVVLTDAAGGSYNFATGQSATIRIPASTRASTLPNSVPLYWFNEATGLWVQEGTATLGGTAPNQYYEGSIARAGDWTAAQVISTVLVSGCVVDETGAAVTRARVEAEGVTYSGMSNALTDGYGNFSVPVRTNATAIVSARSATSLSNARAATTTTTNLNIGNPCLVFSDAAISIKLTWGQAPEDVDSHLLTPHGTHIDYTQKGSLTVAPFANLDIDDVTSFGPEIVTIRRVAIGTYRYYLHNFSNTFSPVGMTGSPVRVEVTYGGNTRVFTPGAGEGASRYWHAFDIDVSAQCGVTVTGAGAWSATAPAAPTQPGGAVAYCN
jgi:uncharacterized protein YfaP (DUF2135 family)